MSSEGQPALAPGQIWSYEARPGEEGSELRILKVEEAPGGKRIVHASLAGLRMKNPHHESGTSEVIQHLPFDEEAVLPSLRKLIRVVEDEPDLAGYRTWREAFDAGEAGVWSQAPAEVVSAMEQVMNQQAGGGSDEP